MSEPGWKAENGVACSRLTVVNTRSIPAPAASWDASRHVPMRGMGSFVVVLESPTDVHGHVLNDVARAFSLPTALASDARGAR